MRLFLGSLIILLFSCALPPYRPRDGGNVVYQGSEVYWEESDFPIRLLVDYRTPDSYLDGIFYSIDIWNQEVKSFVFAIEPYDPELYTPRGCGWVTVDVTEIHPDRPKRWDAYHRGKTRENGFGRYCTGAIKVDDDLPPEWMGLVMVHELGHALGLAHDSERESIMWHSVRGANIVQRIQPMDLDRIRSMMNGTFLPKSVLVNFEREEYFNVTPSPSVPLSTIPYCEFEEN